MSRRYVYLMGDGLQATVIDSQVITILKSLAERGLAFELITYQPRASGAERERVLERLRRLREELTAPVRFWELPVPAPLVLPPRAAGGGTPVPAPRSGLGKYAARKVGLWVRDGLLEARLLRHLAPSICRGQTVVLHARGGAMYLGARLKRWRPSRIRVLADFRGDRPAEYLYKMGTLDSPLARREHAALLAADRAVVRRADVVQCVSAALGRQLQRDHQARLDTLRIVPCVADERRFAFDAGARERVRAAEGWSGRRVIVYSGSMLAWQQPEAVLALYAAVRRTRPDAHLLLLTPDVDAARGLVAAHGLEAAAVTVRAARYEEMAPLLWAADAAVLLRERHPLNAVASPTKLAEYVVAGLPVVVSRGIGDLDELVPRLDLGVLVDDHRDTAELEAKGGALLDASSARRGAAPPRSLSTVRCADASADRAARARRARGTFALGRYLDDWVRVYETI